MAEVDLRLPPPWLPGEWTKISVDASTGLVEMKNKITGLTSLTSDRYSSTIVNNTETDSKKAWYKIGADPASGMLEEFNPILNRSRLSPNPDPLPLKKPEKPVSIKSQFAAPVEGVKAPETAKSSEVTSQKTVNSENLIDIPSIAQTIDPTSVLTGAVIGTGITGTIGVGTIVGVVAGVVASCVELPDYAAKLQDLEKTLSGKIPKAPKLGKIPGLESLGSAITKIDSWLNEAMADIDATVEDVDAWLSAKADTFIADVKNILPDIPKLPDPLKALGLDSIPCPDIVKADKEKTDETAKEAEKTEESTNKEADEKIADRDTAINLVKQNLDKAGIVYHIDSKGTPKIQDVKEECSKGNLPKEAEANASAILTIYAPLWAWLKKYDIKKWEKNCSCCKSTATHIVCKGSKASLTLSGSISSSEQEAVAKAQAEKDKFLEEQRVATAALAEEQAAAVKAEIISLKETGEIL